MIWPFKPRCPLSLTHQVTCERRFAAVARLLGKHRLESPPVLAAADLHPIIEAADTDQLPGQLYAFLVQRFPFPEVPVEVVWGEAPHFADGNISTPYRIDPDETRQLNVLQIHPELAEHPYRVAGLIAAAAAELIVRGGALAETVPGGTFEVMPVFLGLGPIMAEAALFELSELPTNVERWDLSRVATLTGLDFGYTMALSDWSLKTDYADVAQTLRPDARETLLHGSKFLAKTGDCCFEENVFDTSSEHPSLAANRLSSTSSSKQLGALYDLMNLSEVPRDLTDPVAGQLNHREEEIQRAAALVLSRTPELSEPLHDELLMMSEKSPIAIRRAAITALRPGYPNDDRVLDLLSETLRKTDATTATICMNTLLKYSDFPEMMDTSVLKGLQTMVLTLDSEQLSLGVKLLDRIVDDARHAIAEHFAEDPTALAIFDEINP